VNVNVDVDVVVDDFVDVSATRSIVLPCILLLAAALLAPRSFAEEGSAAGAAVPVFDLHCDTLYQSLKKKVDIRAGDGAVDVQKPRAGGYRAQVFAMWAPPGKGWGTVLKMAKT